MTHLVSLPSVLRCFGADRPPSRLFIARIQAHRVLLAAGVVLAGTMPTGVHAQETAGSVRGRVVESGGIGAAGAQIEIAGSSLPGGRSVLADRDGWFSIRDLLPGRYTLSIRAFGWHPTVLDGVRVDLGRTTGLGRVVLQHAPLDLEPLVIRVGDFALDPVHADMGGRLRPVDYAVLPGKRDYRSMVKILPTVEESHRGDPVNVGGATGLENVYFIDGVNVTAPWKSETGTALPYNFIQAVEVKTGGYEARYGRGLGAVINAVTYEGTNSHETNVFGFLTHGALQADPLSEPTLNETEALSYDVGARFSGPIMRDRLWYSAALNPRHERVGREVTELGVYDDVRTSVAFAGNLRLRVSDATSLKLSLFGDPTSHEAVVVPFGATGFTPLSVDSYLEDRETGGLVGSIRFSTRPTASLKLDARVSSMSTEARAIGATETGRTEPNMIDYVAGIVEGGLPRQENNSGGRTTLGVEATYEARRHTIVGGVEYEDNRFTRDSHETGGATLSRVGATEFVAVDQGANGTVKNRIPTLYLQNTIRLGGAFSLNIGLRWSRQALVGGDGETAQSLEGEWQPRAGFVWTLSDRARLFGSVGRFYQQVPLNLASLFYVDSRFVESTYSEDPRNPGATPESVRDMSGSIVEFTNVEDVDAEHHDEVMLGYERRLGAFGRIEARVVQRRLRTTFQWGNDLEGWVVGNPGEGDFAFLPSSRRRYTALAVSADAEWSSRSVRASYVWSRSEGNTPGLYEPYMDFPNPGLSTTFLAPYHAENAFGLLPNDRTHRFKLAGSSELSVGLTGGAILTVESGSPISQFDLGADFPWAPRLMVPRGSAGRTPWLWDLDLRFSYEIPATFGSGARLILDLLHVGNPQGIVWVDQNYLFPDGSENPAYGSPVAFQRPMMARVGLEVEF